MFRDTDFRYLVLSLLVVLVCNLVAVFYQARYNGVWVTNPVELVKWQSAVVPVSVIILALIEVLRVIADRIIKRLNQKDRDETVRQAMEHVRQESARRWNEAMTRFGVRGDDGVVRMDLTPEVLKFILGDTDSK